MKFIRFLVLLGLLAPLLDASAAVEGSPSIDRMGYQGCEAAEHQAALDERINALVEGEGHALVNVCGSEYYSVRHSDAWLGTSSAEKEALVARLEAANARLQTKTAAWNAFLARCQSQTEKEDDGRAKYDDPMERVLQGIKSVQLSIRMCDRAYGVGAEAFNKRLYERFFTLSADCKDDFERARLAEGIATALADHVKKYNDAHAEDDEALRTFYSSQSVSQQEDVRTVIQSAIEAFPPKIQAALKKSGAPSPAVVAEYLKLLPKAQSALNHELKLIADADYRRSCYPSEPPALYKGAQDYAVKLQQEYAECSSPEDLEKWVKKAHRANDLERCFRQVSYDVTYGFKDEARLFKPRVQSPEVVEETSGAAAWDRKVIKAATPAEMEKYIEVIEAAKEHSKKLAPVLAAMPEHCKQRVIQDAESIYRKAAFEAYRAASSDDESLPMLIREEFSPEETARLDAQRDALIQKSSEALAGLSEPEKARVEAFVEKMSDCNRETGEQSREALVAFIADMPDIFGASQEKLEEWIQRGEDIAKMEQSFFGEFQSRQSEDDRMLPPSPEFINSMESLTAARKKSGTPEERSLALARAFRDAAQKNKIKLAMPKWAEGSEEAGKSKTSSSSSIGSWLYQHPLLTGFSAGTILLGASVLKSVVDYKNNPPRDEDGNIIPMKTYVLQQLANFDPKTVQCWLKVGAVAAVAAGVYVKVTTPAAA